MSVELNQKTGRAVAWSSITEIITKLIVPVSSMILARLLTPEAYGAVASINMVITFAEVFTDAGFQKYVVQHEFKSEEELDRGTNVAFWTNFVLSSIAVAIITIFRHQLADFVGSPGLGNAMALASTAILMVALSSITRARFRRALDFKTLFYLRTSATLTPFLITIPLAFTLRNFWALVIGSLAHRLFTVIFLWAHKASWKPRFSYDVKLFKEMFSYTSWTLLESITIWLTGHVDVFLLGKVLSDHQMGVYKVSGTTILGYMTLVTSALMPVLFSTLSRYQNDDENFNKTYWTFFRYTSMLLFPMGVGVFVYRSLAQTILLGAQWEEAALFLGISALANGFTIPLTYLPSEIYRSKGNPKLSMFYQAVLVICIVPIVLFSSKLGFTFLYVARNFGVCLIGAAMHIFLMRFIYKFKISQMFKIMWPFLLSSAVMAVFGMGFVYLSTLMPTKLAMVWQLFSIFLCIIVYFVFLFTFFSKIRQEVFETPVAKKILKKLKVIK